MRETFANILLKLPLDNDLADLRNRIIAVGRPESISPLLKEIEFEIEVCLETQCKEDQYYYYLLRSYCKLGLDQVDDATNIAMYAAKGFRMCGNSWSEIYGHWFLGTIYAYQRRGYLYKAEMDLALEILEPVRQQCLLNGEYDQAGNCQELISRLEHNRDAASKMGTGPLYLPGKNTPIPVHPPASPETGRLLLPWIPKYKAVRAGASGSILFEPTNEFPFAPVVEIDNKPHRIHSLRGTSSTDHNVTLVNGVKYGWALVEGHSMNLSYPTPIPDGCYILFQGHNAAADNDIVVASKTEPDGNLAYMVKRYRNAEKELISETSETGPEYSPIKLGSRHQILGIVIAVAKPEK